MLLGVSVRVVGEKSAPVLLVRTPFGTYLPAGIKYQVDTSKKFSMPYQTCNARGCFASTKMSVTLLALMQNGKKMTVTMQNLKRQDIRIALPLTGFAPAYRKMVAK